MQYEEVYETLQQTLIRMLGEVFDAETADSFAAQAVSDLRSAQETTEEFYVGEFYERLRPVVLEKLTSDLRRCEREAEEVQAQARAIGADLTRRLNAARAAGDQALQHAIWGEREVKQKEVQAKIDALTEDANVIGFRMQAIIKVGSAFGL